MGLFGEPPIVKSARPLLAEVKDNLQAIATGGQIKTAAWDALKVNGFAVFRDAPRTDLALDATYAALRIYVSYCTTAGASPELIATTQADTTSRLNDLRYRLEQIINAK